MGCQVLPVHVWAARTVVVLSAAGTLSILPIVPKNLRVAVGNGRSILGLIARTMAGVVPAMARATSRGAGVVPAIIFATRHGRQEFGQGTGTADSADKGRT